MSSVLPLELYDEIISYLWNDKAALSACSLACRSLTVASQRRLFLQIVLYVTAIPRAGLTLPSGGNPSSFWNGALEKSPHIAEYVQCLQIIDFFGKYRFRLDDWLSISKILPLLSHLKALVVHPGDLDYLPKNIQRAFQDVTRSPTLVYLNLPYRSAFSFSQLFSDSVKHLVIYSGFTEIGTITPFLRYAPPIYLESLHMLRAERACLLPFVMNPDSRFKFSHLRKLSIDIDAGISINCRWLSSLLLSCRKTLEEFRLILTGTYYTVELPESPIFDLSLMTSLKTFTFSFTSDLPSSCVQYLLCSASSTHQRLEEVTVVVEVYTKGYTYDMHWERISEFFVDRHQCPRLRKLSMYALKDTQFHGSKFVTSVNESEITKKLQAGTEMEFIVMEGKPVDYWRFASHERWEDVAFNRCYSDMSTL